MISNKIIIYSKSETINPNAVKRPKTIIVLNGLNLEVQNVFSRLSNPANIVTRVGFWRVKWRSPKQIVSAFEEINELSPETLIMLGKRINANNPYF